MKPFRVTWKLASPVCIQGQLPHLDGLLAWARLEELMKQGADSGEALSFAHDLGSILDRKVGVWKASQVHLVEPESMFTVAMTRRLTIDEIEPGKLSGLVQIKANAISRKSGRYRGYDMRIHVQWARGVRAWGVGDVDEIRRLLESIDAVGKLTRCGWGRVEGLEVSEDAEALDRWKERNLPLELKTERHFRANGALSPPYWDKTRWGVIAAFGE